MHGCKQLKVELHDGRTMYYEVADDRLKGKDKQFIWNMGYLKAAEFRWFQQNSQDMFESNLDRKFR